MADGHLSAEEIAGYIDHTLSVDRGVRAESHLAVCAECRHELAASSHIVGTAPAANRRRYIGPAAGFAAAAGILVAIMLALPERDDVELQRGSGIEPTSRVQAVFPATGSTIGGEPLNFIWRRDDDASYQVSVVDSAGAVLWVTTTSDTVARLPQTVRLRPGARYFWYVDALRADGFSVSSGPMEFKTAR